MEDTIEVDSDDVGIQRVARQLMLQYGSRAAEFARGQARIAEDVDAEQTWLKVAEAVDRD
jgi:hypothetical protein